jgi:DNA-binding response OmpR family regulator
MKVLLIDDEEEFIVTLSERLKLRNIDSTVALNGESALQLLNNDYHPDVILLDLKMPGMDGMEVLRQIRKKFTALQVIMLTGHGSEKDKKEAQRLGVYDYLSKPVQIEKLMKTLNEANNKK